MNLKLDIGKRIALFIEKNKWSKAEFARRVGIYPQDVNKYLAGEFDFNNILAKLLENGMELRWLLTGESGEESAAKKAALLESIKNRTEGGINVYSYPIVSVIGAGSVVPYDTEPTEYITINYTHKNCVAMKVQGDSMKDLIDEGDIVIVDLTQRPRENDIVAIRMKKDGE